MDRRAAGKFQLPWCKRPPRRLDIGGAVPEYPNTVQDHFRRIYFKVIDLLIATIQKRFQQKGYQMLQKLETILTQKNFRERDRTGVR